jgi:hypothetical protein
VVNFRFLIRRGVVLSSGSSMLPLRGIIRFSLIIIDFAFIFQEVKKCLTVGIKKLERPCSHFFLLAVDRFDLMN